MSRTNWKKEFIDWYSELVNYDDLKKEDKAHFNEMKKILGGMPDYFHMFYDKSVKDGEDPAKYIEFKNKADVRALTEDLRAAVDNKEPQKMRMAMTNVFRGGMPKDLDAAQKYHDDIFEAEFQEDALDVPAESANIKRRDQKYLKDYMDAADRYQKMQEDRRARLDAELEEYKAELAQKKLAYKEMRKENSKILHPINFLARWSVQIKQRIAAHNAIKSYMQDFQAAQKDARDEIESGLRQLDRERKDVQNSYAKRHQDATWKTMMEQKTRYLNVETGIEENMPGERSIDVAQSPNPIQRRSAGVERMVQNNVQQRGDASRDQQDKQPKQLSKEEIKFF